jgi:predicted GIY-YIG superfamily endonuclease
MHNDGRGAAYTRSHLPVILIWQEEQPSESTARKREAEIKRFKKQEKENMVYLSSNSKSKPITMAKGNNAQKKNTKKLKKPKK